ASERVGEEAAEPMAQATLDHQLQTDAASVHAKHVVVVDLVQILAGLVKLREANQIGHVEEKILKEHQRGMHARPKLELDAGAVLQGSLQASIEIRFDAGNGHYEARRLVCDPQAVEQ